MVIGSGLSAQLGLGVESAYGTYVAPTRFLEFASEELKNIPGFVNTRSLGDQFQRSSRFRAYSKGASGKVDFEVQNKGFGLLLQHALGSGSIAQVGATAEWKSTLIPDVATGGTGLQATVQIGRPDTTATVRAFSYLGGKITDWELKSALDQALMLSTTWDFQSETTAQTLATQTLPSGSTPLIFIDASLTIDTVATPVKGITITGKKALDTERRYLGAVTTKAQPIANGEYEVTGTLDMEFAGLTEYAKFVAGTLSALVATWSYGTIPTTANPYKLVATIPFLYYSGETPTVKDSGIVQQSLPFRAVWNGTLPLIKVEYSSDDVAL